MKNIFLIGFMGSGKSTISSYLNKNFNMEVVEMDEILAKRENMTISEIFKTKGEEYFREKETSLLKEISLKENVVVSCGGGVATRDVNILEMRKSGVVVLLSAKPETILKRVESSNDRPLLEGNKNVEFISDLLEKRREMYLKAADIIVKTDNKSAEEISNEILKKVKE